MDSLDTCDLHEEVTRLRAVVGGLEKELAATRDRLWIRDASLDMSVLAIAFADPNGTITYVNRAFLALWGYRHREEVVGKNTDEFWSMRDKAARINRALAHRGGWIGEIEAQRRDRSAFFVQISVTVITDRHGHPDCTMISFIDISQRKEAQLKQQELLAFNRERVKELNCLYAIAHILSRGGQSTEEVLAAVAEQIPVSWSYPAMAGARITVNGRQIATGGFDVNGSLMSAPIRTGELPVGEVAVSYSGSVPAADEGPFLREERTLLEAIASEIGSYLERHAAQEQMRLSQQQLLAADKLASLGVLVSEIAHEINNPTNYILLNSRFLKNAWQAVLPILDEYFRDNGDFLLAGLPFQEAREELGRLQEGVLAGAGRIAAIVQRLKEFAGGAPDDLSQDVNVNQTVEAALALTGGLVRESTAVFRLQLEPTLPTIKGNPQQIEQVLINLITNACHALASPAQALSIATAHDPVDGVVTITVSDEGCGIGVEALAKVFEPFFTTKHTRGGTGLGLSISRSIINSHGGTLRIASRPGEGTVVTVVLPVERSLAATTEENP